MAIEVSNPVSSSFDSTVTNFMRQLSQEANVTTTAAVAQPTTSVADAQTVDAAAQQIQAHLSGSIQPPQFSVDYLSGIDVMTVRAAGTGEVLFQLPGSAALRLAQLMKEGTPIESFGIVDKTA